MKAMRTSLIFVALYACLQMGCAEVLDLDKFRKPASTSRAGNSSTAGASSTADSWRPSAVPPTVAPTELATNMADGGAVQEQLRDQQVGADGTKDAGRR